MITIGYRDLLPIIFWPSTVIPRLPPHLDVDQDIGTTPPPQRPLEETSLTSHNLGAQPSMRRLEWLCDASAALGALVLSAVALMTTVSVIGRAFFAHPILGDVELVQLGGAIVVASFLPYTQFRRANIIVDFFTSGARAATQRRMDAFGTLLYTAVVALITWRVAAGGLSMQASQERSMLMDLPLWIPYLLMLPGLSLCVFIGAVQAVAQLRGEGVA